MKYYKLLLLTVVTLLSIHANGQWCGNVASQIDIDRLLKNKEAVKNGTVTKTNATTYIPITFHIVRESNGDGGVREDKIAEQLCALNNDYAPLDIVFFAANQKFNYINSTFLYQNPTNSQSGTKMIQEKFNNGANSINVFICENADTGSQGTTLGYYDPFLDVVVMKKSEVNGNAGTLSHELGHFFSLMHVFNGWDGVAWEAAVHGNPVNSQYSPNGVLNELADGSNCESAGDFLCDTPADYNLGFGWSGCTEYGGGCMDFTGELLDPQEENFMSYFIGCAQYYFSDEQVEMIFADYNSADRDFLETTYVPDVGPLSQEVVLEGPVDSEIVDEYNYVGLHWNKVDNVMGYMIELRVNISKKYFFTTENAYVFADLDPDKTYNWSVMAFTETGGCADYSEEGTFKTGSVVSVNDLAEFELKLYPTIINNNEFVLDINQQTDSKLSVFSVAGQQVDSQNVSLQKGSNKISFNQELSSGMYFMNLEIDGKIQNFKFIVQ